MPSHVAIFGVMQHAHASATSGDEFGIDYVRGFLSLMSQRTSDRAWVYNITNVLKERLQENCNRVRSQIASLHEATLSVNPHGATSVSQPTHKVKHRAQMPNHQATKYQQRKHSGMSRSLTANQQSFQQPDISTSQPTEKSSALLLSKQSKLKENRSAHSTTHHESTRQQFGRTQRQDQRFNSFLASIANFGHAPDPTSTAERQVAEATFSSTRPKHHLFESTSVDAQDEVITSIRADIRNYTEPGEDLDWTKITDKLERKRLQGIIGGRKYRERMLAASGKGGSGGNYPCASGEGSSISKGYGRRTGQGASQARLSQQSSANISSVKPESPLASATATAHTSARGQPYTRPKPISISSSDEPDSDRERNVQPISNGKMQPLRSDEQSSSLTGSSNHATVKVQAKSIAERYMEKMEESADRRGLNLTNTSF